MPMPGRCKPQRCLPRSLIYIIPNIWHGDADVTQVKASAHLKDSSSPFDIYVDRFFHAFEKFGCTQDSCQMNDGRATRKDVREVVTQDITIVLPVDHSYRMTTTL